MSSAPCSPSNPAQNGAAIRVPASMTRTPASFEVTCYPQSRRFRLTGEAEDALADQVALDLVRAGEDRSGLVEEVRTLPRAVAGIAGRAFPERGCRSEHVEGDVVE